MIWKQPHISKIYEALGAIGDGRIEIAYDENYAKVNSSSGNKFYEVRWNDDFSQMMANDNSAYWSGKLSYTMIAVLLLKGKLKYDEKLAELLKGFKWKDINVKFKNNFDKTVKFILEELKDKVDDVVIVEDKIKEIYKQIEDLKIEELGSRIKPPQGY